MNLWPLPFLWIFPPSTPYSSLPLLLLEYFLPEVCQTLNHLFVWPCSGRNSQQGGGTTKAFLFICLGFVFWFFVVVFFLSLFFPPLLLPPHNKISSYAQKANLATLTTLRTLFSNLSFYMIFKSLNILNKFFHSIQVGASCNMHWIFDCSTFSLVFQVMQRCQLHNILICHRSALPLIGIFFPFDNRYIKLNAIIHSTFYHCRKQVQIPHPHADKVFVLSTPPSCHIVCSPASKKFKLENKEAMQGVKTAAKIEEWCGKACFLFNISLHFVLSHSLPFVCCLMSVANEYKIMIL